MANEKIIYRFPRYVEDHKGKKRKIHSFSKYKTSDETFHADTFNLNKEELQRKGFFTKDKHRLCIHRATEHDQYRDLKRGPQTINNKDIGLFITHVPITKKSTVLEIGVGSGKATMLLSSIAKKVDSYDVSKKNINIAKKNIESIGKNNVTFYNHEAKAKEQYKENTYHAALIDVPTPHHAIQTVLKAVKNGGIIAFYTLHTTQFKQLYEHAPKKLRHQKTVNLQPIEWKVDEGLRPKTTQIIHTGFLSFYRRIS